MSLNRTLFTVSLILIMSLVINTCEDFADETFDLSAVDEAGISSIADTLGIQLPMAVGAQWIYNYSATLTLDALLQNYYSSRFDSTYDTTEIATDTTLAVIVLTIDSTFFFAYSESIDFQDTINVNTINGNDTLLYFDTSLVHIDTVKAGTESVAYSSDLTFEENYPLPYITLRWVGGKRDTLYAQEINESRVMVELYTALNTLDLTVGTNDTAYVVNLPSDSTSYSLLAFDEAGKYVFYLNHFAAPNLFNSAGSLIEIESDDMSPELIAGLYELPGPVPTIKGRYEYDLDAGVYLFEIARLEATTEDNFRVTILRD